MNISQKTVLLFQPSKFQAKIWRLVLSEHDIFVIWEANYNNHKHLENYFKISEFKADALIIDLKIDDSYELCRWFHENHPSSKIILTTDPKNGYSSVIRRWAMSQGVDDLLMNFQKKNLFSSVITNINSVLKALDYPPAQPEKLVRALHSLGQKNVSIPQGAIQLTYPSLSNHNPQSKTATTLSPLVPYSLGFFIAILLTVTIILDVSVLWLVSPVQELQKRVLVHIREQKKSAQTKVSNLKESDSVPQGIFSYGGSTTWAPIRQIVNPHINEKYPQLKLRYVPPINATPGSGTGIRMLLEGELDFSQSSRSINPKEHILAHQQGFSLREYPIAIDAIAIAIHPSLKVSKLTTEQLKQIYTGEITNWQKVNGVTVYYISLNLPS